MARVHVVCDDQPAGREQRHQLVQVIVVAFFVSIQKQDVNAFLLVLVEFGLDVVGRPVCDGLLAGLLNYALNEVLSDLTRGLPILAQKIVFGVLG